MNWIIALTITVIWAFVAPQLILQSLLALINSVVTLTGAVIGRTSRRDCLLFTGVAFFQFVLFAILFFVGDAFVDWIPAQYENEHQVIFWLIVVLSSFFMLFQLPAKVKKTWEMVSDPHYKTR
jgi:hypothetical protein